MSNFLDILDEADVEPEQYLEKLAEIAKRHLALRDRLAALVTDEPAIRTLIDQAQAEIGQGRYDQADDLLTQAENAGLAAARQAEELEREARDAIVFLCLAGEATDLQGQRHRGLAGLHGDVVVEMDNVIVLRRVIAGGRAGGFARGIVRAIYKFKSGELNVPYALKANVRAVRSEWIVKST